MKNSICGVGRISTRGSALIGMLLLGAVVSTFYISFVARSIAESRAVMVQRDAIQSVYLAEAGIDAVKRDLYELFEQHYISQGRTAAAFDWFNDLTLPGAQVSKNVVLPVNATLNSGQGGYTVQIIAVDTSQQVPKDVTVRATATINNSSRSLVAVIRYSMSPSRVFDYSYFVNNFGWFYGGGISSAGDIRSNGNFAFQGNPTVNGDVYASLNPAISAAGTISGNSRNDTITHYRNHSANQARPSNPTANPQDIDGDMIPEEFPYENGYAGTSTRYIGQQVLDMPYLGNLSYYQSLAVVHNGSITQNGVPLITNTHSGDIVLIGTDAHPIEISGPVVVSGDVLIKGKVRGQGTIYSGRNVHILGDVRYDQPPVWDKPDIAPEATDAVNSGRDFLGLAAKGNVIIGDYTRNDWKTTVGNYLKPNFTKPYEVDPTDTGIGYVSYYQDGKPYFNGNYTQNDGGTKHDGTARKYFESSFPDAYITTVADGSNAIRNVDAVVYTNHAFAGRVGAFTWNGSIVSRDEAIIYSGNITMNYDVRARDVAGTANVFFLPRALALPHTVYIARN